MLRIRPGEGRRTALLFTHLLLASAVFILGRTVRDTLFLSRYPIRYLPWMFVLYGVASAVTVVVYARYADRVARHRLIVASTAVGIASYLATWALVRAGQSWIYPAFYVWAEVVSNLFIVQFWTLANDLFDAREAKRLFGTIGAARMLGVVIVGLGAGAAVRAIGTAQLLFVLAALMAGIAACAVAVSSESRATGETAADAPGSRGPAPRIAGDPYVRALAVMILCIFVALTIGDYQFKRIARDAFQEDALAEFFALFYAATGILSFVFQIVITPRILARRGVGAGMTVMPAVFGAASAMLLAVPKLGIATVMKFADNGFQYTIHETTLQALYVPFAPAVKARTRAFLDAVIKPLSYGMGGLALVLLTPHLSVSQLSWATVPVVAAWLALIPLVRRRYLVSLESTLSARGAFALDHETLLDGSGRRALVGVLQRGTPSQVMLALEQLEGESDAAVRAAVAALASHPDPDVRTAALYDMAHAGGGNHDTARGALRDPIPEVRAAAAAAWATLAEDDAVEDLLPLLSDRAPDVRVASLAGLIRHGGVEGGIEGGAELGRLLASGNRTDRIAAARALRHLGGGAYRPLRKLLDDPDPAVRRAALKSAPGVADARLVPVLLARLADPTARTRAATALVAVGTPGARALGEALDAGDTPRSVRLLIPRILRRIVRPESYGRLREHVRAEDSQLRLRIFAAMAGLRRSLRLGPEPLAFVQDLVSAEIRDTYRNQLAWAGARAAWGAPLIEEEFAFRRGRAIRRILRILELRGDPGALRLARKHLNEPARRANALEVLDTLLDPALRPAVMPFVDEVTADERQRRAAAFVRDVPAPHDFLLENCRHPNPYVVLLALDALTRRHDPAAAAEGARLADHPDPLVREGAARAMGRPLPEGRMYSTLEKVLLLKHAPIFSRVSGEDLAPLARVAQEEHHPPGAQLVEEGASADRLFVIVRGRVAIEHAGHRVAELQAGEAFGEMAVLDREPRSASAVALEETEVLWIGSDEFYETLHEQVEIAEGVIIMLSARLREATAELARMKQAAAG